jgi:hypothetical protein
LFAKSLTSNKIFETNPSSKFLEKNLYFTTLLKAFINSKDLPKEILALLFKNHHKFTDEKVIRLSVKQDLQAIRNFS